MPHRILALCAALCFCAQSQPCADYACDSLVLRSVLDSCRLDGVAVTTVSQKSGDRIFWLRLCGFSTTSSSLPRYLTFLPGSIGRLTGLQHLDLSFNQMLHLPREIGMLPDLQYLDISYNQLTILPDSIGQCSALTTLNATGNQLDSVPLSLGSCRNLQVLSLADNYLTRLPDTLCSIPRLTQFTTAFNRLTELPPGIGRMSSLRMLYVDHNRLTALPSAIGDLNNLRNLSAGSNLLTDLPARICSLTAVTYCYFDSNRICDPSPEAHAWLDANADDINGLRGSPWQSRQLCAGIVRFPVIARFRACASANVGPAFDLMGRRINTPFRASFPAIRLEFRRGSVSYQVSPGGLCD
jgi:hypothetical protein